MNATGREAAQVGVVPRPLAVEELLALLRAAWRGEFSAAARPGGGGYTGVSSPDTASAAGGYAGLEPVPARGRAADAPAVADPATAVAVVAAHAGAGASTVALALAEALAAGGVPTRLVDCADPTRSGLAAATTTELGVDQVGWRCGRRESPGALVHVDRLAGPVPGIDDTPPPRPPTDTGAERVVVDVGWPARHVLGGRGWVAGLVRAGRLVLVCRATVPGLRQTEHLLAGLTGIAGLAGAAGRPVVIAAVGPSRWPGAVRAGCGPALRAARAAGLVVGVPADRHLESLGLTADALPKPVAAAGRQLAALLR